MNLQDMAAWALRYSSQLDWKRRASSPGDHSSRASDPLGTGALFRFLLSSASEVRYGRVVGTTAGVHCYRVVPDGSRFPLNCCSLVHGSLSPVGPRQLGLIPPGSRVYYVKPQGSTTGAIIGVEPFAASDSRSLLPDFIGFTSRCGLWVDEAHRSDLKLSEQGRLINFNGGRPLDEVLGYAGWMAETGVAILMSSFMAAIKADEDIGFWAFYETQLARMAGVHIEQTSSGTDRSRYNDQGELCGYDGLTPYPDTEGLGVFSGSPGRDIPAQTWQVDDPSLGPVEPIAPDQVPFHRLQAYPGYLSRLYSRYVVAPPQGASIWKLSDPTPPVGLYSERLSSDGRLVVSSARGVGFELSPVQTPPKRIRRHDDPSGDNQSNYSAAGLYGGGDLHIDKPDPDNPSGRPEVPGSCADDRSAYDRWSSAYVFSRHKNDFAIAEASTVVDRVGPETFLAGSQQYLPSLESVAVQVTPGQPPVQIVKGQAFNRIEPDGNLNMGGAYGEQVRSVNGSLHLDAPLDFIVRCGRNFVVEAGQDVIVRGLRAGDFSFTQGELRFKARSNVAVCSTDAGILMDARGPKRDMDYTKLGSEAVSSGIVLRTGADVVSISAAAYLRTTTGDIRLDAARGKADVQIQSRSFLRYLTDESADNFGQESADGWKSVGVTRWSAASSSVAGNVGLSGRLAVGEAITARGTIQTTEGGLLSATNTVVATPAQRQSGKSVIDYLVEQPSLRAKEEAIQGYADSLAKDHAYPAPGSDDQVERIRFSHRTTEQYGTQGWQFVEARWQRLARAAGDSLATWREESVDGPAGESYPFPGLEAFTSGSARLEIDSVFLGDGGVDLPRNAQAFADGRLGQPRYVGLDQYTVNGTQP